MSQHSTTPDQLCFATAARKASRRLTQIYDVALQPCGLRSTQYAILNELARHRDDTLTMMEIASLLVLDRSAFGHNVRPLERDGYVAMVEGTDDRRRKYVALTELGAEKYLEARALWKVAQKQIAKVIGKSRSEDIRSALLAIAHSGQLG